MATYVAILDIGHGNSAIIHDEERAIIIDAGPRDGILKYLTENGISKIDAAILSHADADHIGGLLNVIDSEKFEVGTVWLNTDSIKSTVIKDDLAWAIHRSSTKLNTSLSPDSFDLIKIGSVQIDVLAPSAYLTSKGPGQKDRKGRQLTTNSISAIIRVSNEEENLVLFSGDVDEVGLENIKEDSIDIRSRILVFPHHGGSSGHNTKQFTNDLLAEVKPDRVIFSIARTRFKNPSPEIVKTIRKFDKDIWITCTQLSTHCSQKDISVQGAFVEKEISKGYQKKHCCSGSIVIDVSQNLEVPDKQAHRAFVNKHVTSPLCVK